MGNAEPPLTPSALTTSKTRPKNSNSGLSTVRLSLNSPVFEGWLSSVGWSSTDHGSPGRGGGTRSCLRIPSASLGRRYSTKATTVARAAWRCPKRTSMLATAAVTLHGSGSRDRG
eukprot:5699148-Lingulodinium_polyedra.AAC.1